ncbi:hydroxyproline-rich glycoprotein family protein [Tasmannia lanceolata]|uniref:hydroxyproline-rich glycoprotein family protein n=1 Tax=Tasmannia lanceolata TaxID=3420 RepID=UPI0040644DDA
MASIEQVPICNSMEKVNANQIQSGNSISLPKTPPQPLKTDRKSQFPSEDYQRNNGPDHVFKKKMASIEQVPICNSMEKVNANQIQSGNSISLPKTPPHPLKTDRKSQFPSEDYQRNNGPDHVKVPKAFNFPERYMSPTDHILSPVSKGLLARNKKIGGRLPPTKNPPKTPDSCFQDVGDSLEYENRHAK